MSLPDSSVPFRVSVLIPLFNAGPFIAEAIRSIQNQSYPVSEIIVVNDGSTDDSPGIAAAFPGVTLLHQENSGCASALNRGLQVATGNVLAFLDADDRWLPEKISLQLQALERDPGLDIVFCQCQRFKSELRESVWQESSIDVVPGVAKTSMLIRRSSFDRAGTFPVTAQEHDFMDWFARAREAGLRHLILPETLSERRIHDRNHGKLRKNDQQETYFKTLKVILDRRRGVSSS